MSDAARASVEKLINDAVAATASAVTGILTTEESATPTYAADSAVKGIGPNHNDSASTADSAVKGIGPNHNDSASTADSAVKGIGPNHNDSASTADSAVKGIGPNHNDSATTADSGSVRSQGYVDFTYMAEDYVGSYETF